MKRHSSVIPLLVLILGLSGPLAAWAQFRLPGRAGDIFRKGKDATEGLEVTTEQEIAMGREVAAKMIAYYGVYENPKLAAYVRKVGEAAAMQADRQDLAYHFEILDVPVVNAFAAPGGFIFITRGLLENISSEAELAGVLAHEVAHVSARHIVKAFQRNKLMAAGLKEAGNFTPGSQYLDNLAKEMLLRLIDRGLEPADENDADEKGVVYAYNAGYRPDGLRSFLELLEKVTAQSAEKTSWLSRTHPKTADRIRRVDQVLAQRKLQSEGRATLAERYQAALKESAQ